MPEQADFTPPSSVLALLTQAQEIAERRILDEPLDLAASDVALGIALLREQALQVGCEHALLASPPPGDGLVESLESAERLTRDLRFTDANPARSCEFVISLCDLIREARTLA